MSARRLLTHASTALATAGLLLSPFAARAQLYTPGPGAPPSAPTGDPPARVGRLGFLQGTVSFHTADEDHWEPAALNYPVSDGNAFWTEPAALARIEVDASTLWMNGSTELDVTRIDLHTVQATEPQGELYLHVRALPQGDSVVVQTPRGAVTVAANGRYDIAAGDAAHPTTVTVLDGAAQVSGQNLALDLHANQMASITGAQPVQSGVGPAQQDAFLAAMLQRETPPPAAVVAQGQAAPPIVQQMTGSDDLARYGAWQDAPQYGRVWYPQVAADWVPYRHGHWGYVGPWGWTWIDDAPWGFAPFHYGRWVELDHRWGWTPEGDRPDPSYGPPVYAPALVTFFGIGAVAAVGVGAAAFAHGNIGWVPLGPREPYYPPYRVSDGYLRRVNGPGVPDVTNIRQTYNTITINNFANRGGATFAPQEAMLASRPIAPARASLPPAELAELRPVGGRPVIAPGAATFGVTPTIARDMRFAPPPRPAAPGPAVNPAFFRPQPGRPAFEPPLRGGPPVPAAPAGPNEARPNDFRPAPPPGPRPPEAPRPPEIRPPAGPASIAPPQRPVPPEAPRPVEPPRAPAEQPRPPAPRPDVQRPEVQRPEPPRPEPPRPAPPRPEQARPEPPRPEPPRPAPPRPEQARPEQPRPEAPRQEPPRTEAPRGAPPPHQGGRPEHPDDHRP